VLESHGDVISHVLHDTVLVWVVVVRHPDAAQRGRGRKEPWRVPMAILQAKELLQYALGIAHDEQIAHGPERPRVVHALSADPHERPIPNGSPVLPAEWDAPAPERL